MKKEDVRKMVVKNLNQDEQLVGYFAAMYMPSFWWFILVGPLFFVGAKQYYLGVTNLGVHFHKMTFLGKPGTYEFFSNDEIDNLKVGSSFLQVPLKFYFSNKRKLSIKAQRKGVEKIPKIDDETVSYLKALKNG